MIRSRALIAPLSLAAVTLLCALCGPALGSPGPLVMGALVVAAAVSSIAGFAFSALAGAVLFRLMDDPVQVVQLLITCSIANQIVMISAIHRNIHWHRLAAFVAGGMCGLPAGIWLLLHAERRHYLFALGLLLLAHSAWMLLGPQPAMRLPHKGLDVAAGFLGGITGGAAALPSPPLTVLSQIRGEDKLTQRALFQPFILAIQAAATALIPLLRPTPVDHASFEPGLLFCVPAGLLGTWIGMGWFHRLSNRQFCLIVNALLAVSGLSFVL